MFAILTNSVSTQWLLEDRTPRMADTYKLSDFLLGRLPATLANALQGRVEAADENDAAQGARRSQDGQQNLNCSRPGQ
jgi:hypothetical protein